MSDPAAALATTYPRGQAATRAADPSAAPTRAERVLSSLLRRIEGDALELHTPTHAYHFGHAAGGDAGPAAVMQLHDDAVFARVLRSGDIGFAEAYIDGQWSLVFVDAKNFNATPDSAYLLLYTYPGNAS